MKSNYKKEFPKKERIHNSSKLIEQNKGQVPVICEKDPNSKIEELKKTKYLINKKLTIAQFISLLKIKLELESKDALFLLVKYRNNYNSLTGNETFDQVYEKYKDSDGFLYTLYTSKEIWGN